MIKAISFDFWETLVSGEYNAKGRVEQRLNKLLEILNKYRNLTFEEVKSAYDESSNAFTKIWINDYRTLDASENLKIILEILDLEIIQEDFEEIAYNFENSILDFPPRLFPELLDLLPKLKEKYPLAIISDTGYSSGEILRMFLEREKVLSNFSAFVFSNEVLASKPNPKNYDIVCERFGIQTNELLHIGDNQRTDIVGIQNVGGIGFLFAQTNKKWVESTTAEEILDSWNDFENQFDKYIQ